MRLRRWVRPAVPISTLFAVGFAGIMLLQSSRVRADEGNNENSQIQQGFAIAPVPLNLAGKNRSMVGLGSYLVNASADCNGCHTLDPTREYTMTGNPYLRSPMFFSG